MNADFKQYLANYRKALTNYVTLVNHQAVLDYIGAARDNFTLPVEINRAQSTLQAAEIELTNFVRTVTGQ